MSQESGITVFSALSPSDISIQHPNRRSKISYTREFLLSLSKVDTAVRLPREVKLSLPCVLEDTSGLLSPPFCVPDSAFYKSMPQNSTMKFLDNANLQLHRSSEPYRPPCRLKASPPSSRDSTDLLNSDTSGSSESTNQEKVEGERWRKCMITLPNEDIWYSCKNTDSHEYSEEFMLSARNVNTLHSTPNVINQQSDASQKPSLIQGDAVQPSILPESTKGCCTQLQQGQKFVNHADTSLNTLSVLDDSKFQVGQPEGPPHVMEPLQNSKPSNFLSQENHCEVEYEKLIMELRSSSTPVCIPGSPRRNAISDLSEASISPLHVKEKQFISAGFELCLPEEDSLISFDETFFMPDFENSSVVEADSPSSPRAMVEKLVESILNDENCPAPHLDDHDPIVHHGAGLEGYCHSLHSQQYYGQFCSNQLNPKRDEQAHNSFQRSSTDSAIYSFFSSNITCQPFPLSHEELRRFHDKIRRFDHAVSQPMFKQMMNPGKQHLCASQTGVTPHLPLQNGNCGPFMGSTSDPHSDGSINQSVLDRLVDMNLRARQWHPYVGGF